MRALLVAVVVLPVVAGCLQDGYQAIDTWPLGPEAPPVGEGTVRYEFTPEGSSEPSYILELEAAPAAPHPLLGDETRPVHLSLAHGNGTVLREEVVHFQGGMATLVDVQTPERVGMRFLNKEQNAPHLAQFLTAIWAQAGDVPRWQWLPFGWHLDYGTLQVRDDGDVVSIRLESRWPGGDDWSHAGSNWYQHALVRPSDLRLTYDLDGSFWPLRLHVEGLCGNVECPVGSSQGRWERVEDATEAAGPEPELPHVRIDARQPATPVRPVPELDAGAGRPTLLDALAQARDADVRVAAFLHANPDWYVSTARTIQVLDRALPQAGWSFDVADGAGGDGVQVVVAAGRVLEYRPLGWGGPARGAEDHNLWVARPAFVSPGLAGCLAPVGHAEVDVHFLSGYRRSDLERWAGAATYTYTDPNAACALAPRWSIEAGQIWGQLTGLYRLAGDGTVAAQSGAAAADASPQRASTATGISG